MERNPKRPSAELLRAVTDLDAAAIDTLYGLEPVFEPAAPVVAADVIEWVTIGCPYCGEVFETQVDLSAGSATYVEDCQICCQPIEVGFELDGDGQLTALRAQRMD
jgi:hypothetical protein